MTGNLTDSEHPWQSSEDEFRYTTLPYLVEHGKEIGKSTLPSAKIIIQQYQQLTRSFDPMTHILLKEAIANYKKEAA